MARKKAKQDQGQPKSVFDWDLGTPEEVERWLETAPFDERGVLHLPEYEVIREVRQRLEDRAKQDGLTNKDVLSAYQELHASAAASDLVCGVLVGGKRCGGIMDEEVTPFGIYYQCRRQAAHRIPK